MAVSKEELIREFSKAIQEGNAAVFAGAGLSRPSGFVDWRELLRPLAKDISLDVNKESNLLAVAQYYRNSKGTRNGINQRIVEEFTRSVELNENVSILTRLPISTYWTTNYDSLIENGIIQANRKPDVKSEPEQLSILVHARDAVVYKMHGDATNPAHAVLTKHDYEMYERKRPLFRTALKGDLVSKTFLFIGFSFEDPNLDYILGQIHTLLGEDLRDHYCFFKRVQRSDYKADEDFGYEIAKQELREQDLRQYGIQTCFVDSYEEITDVLRRIESAVRMKNVFISGSAIEFSNPWNQDLAEIFARKLAYELVTQGYRITTGFGLGIGSAVINGALEAIYKTKYKHLDEHLCLRPFPQGLSNPYEREIIYTRYRENMLDDVGIAIFIFGNKKHGDLVVNASGCKKEYEIAVNKGRIVIPVGSTGYMAQELLEVAKQNPNKYSYLQDYIDRLATETTYTELVSLIMEIVKKQQIQ